MDYRAYDAMGVRAGVAFPRLKDVVLEVMTETNALMRRSDIIDEVHRITGISIDYLQANISSTLNQLRKEGMIKKYDRNHWRIPF